VTWDHPQNEKASGKENRSLGGFTFKHFGWHAFMTISLMKVMVMLKLYRKTQLYRDKRRIYLCRRDVQFLDLPDLTSD
jgi:hypothetical protein